MERLGILHQRIIIVLVLLLLWVLGVALPATADQCRLIAGQEVCILSLHRSAKYYWEYWVTLSLDGVKQPERIYDCRVFAKERPSRKIPPELSADTVKAESIGGWVCRLYKN